MVFLKSRKEAKKARVFKAFFQILPKLARVSPLFFAAWQASAVLHGLSYGIIAPITQRLFDRAMDFAAQKAELAAVLAALAALGLAHVIKQALNGIANFMHMMYYRRAEGVFSLGLHEKMGKIAPVCFEDTGTLDEINQAMEGKNEAVWFTGTLLLMLNFYFPYFLSMGVYLWRIKPLLAVSLALVFAPTLLTQVLRSKVFAKAEDEAAPLRREFDYCENCMAGREYFKETRVLGAFSYFRKQYTETLALLQRISFRASVKSDLAELGMKLLSLGGYAGILLMLLRSLLRGEISAGAFAAIFGSVGQMFDLMEEMICYNLGAVARDFGRVQNYLRFLRMPERETPEPAAGGDISLRDVSFTYPGGLQKAIDGVTLTIREGETVAVVGENGSGKTTLVRLLTGLYRPDEGEAARGDMRVSAVFQNYRQYQMTLRENIGISDTDSEAVDETLDTVCRQAGVGSDIGYDAMLSREFDGIDLSGGEWQRVAIARGFYRLAVPAARSFIVLDEPTAAIDPIEETRVYNRFAEISRGKTALIVTHRLGSVRLADRILVMKEGRLAEQGTHAQLMTAGGEYARLYRSQEQWYKAEKI